MISLGVACDENTSALYFFSMVARIGLPGEFDGATWTQR